MIGEIIPLTELPAMRPVVDALKRFGLDDLIPRIGIRTVREFVIDSQEWKARLDLSNPFSFLLAETEDGGEIIIPMEPGVYEVSAEDVTQPEIEECARMRIVEVVMDGSREKWDAIMNQCVN